MTIKYKLRLILLSAALGISAITAYSRMTDEQVVAYVKQATAQGKSKEQIGKELLARGVTPDQVERLKSRYENTDDSQEIDRTQTDDRTRRASSSDSQINNKNNQGQSRQNRQQGQGQSQGQYQDYYQQGYDSYTPLNGDDAYDMFNIDLQPARNVFGNNVFRNNSLSFEPNENVATPKSYVLGPGDEIIVDIWGESEDHIRQTISPEGSIMVSQIGPVYLNGMTIDEANSYIKNKFSTKYAGISGSDPDSQIDVTLGQVRTIQVDIMGQVNVPGTYRLSPFSTVFHALYMAGGINDIGTLRNIQVLRNGKRIVGVDVYEYLFGGKQTGNIRLQEGDVILVPDYVELVNIEGNVKRPMYYEMKEEETLADLLEYAGGFTGDAYTEQVRLARQTGKENELFNIISGDFASYQLKDGDAVTVGTILDRYANRVEIQGATFRPGMYALATDLRTVGDLIKRADGLTEDAFTGRALLYREGTDLSMEIIPVDIEGILAGTTKDITLKRNDVLFIPSVEELEEKGELTISGYVSNPGNYPYAANTSIEDLIIQAGGLITGASTAKVDVSRRIIDPTSLKPTDVIAECFSFSLNNGLIVDKKPDFTLMPYDIVEIRKSPGYSPQHRIEVKGEVTFDGQYTLEKRNERVSDIVRRAGGLNHEAFVRGAHILRKMTQAEIETRDQTMRLAGLMEGAGDSISTQRLQLDSVYTVAIELDKALAAPGSDYDVVMKENDVLVVPELINTVKITGDVMFPNTVTYVKGKDLKYYVNQAGGYGDRANKGKAFVVYMNGNVTRAGKKVLIEPGCQIIVPSKHKSNGVNWNAILSLTSATGSLATMAAVVANLIKN